MRIKSAAVVIICYEAYIIYEGYLESKETRLVKWKGSYSWQL